MDDDEELRSQCFGGDYPAQTFDQPVMKRYNFFEWEQEENVFIRIFFSSCLDNDAGGMLTFFFTNKWWRIQSIQLKIFNKI